jgi:hypothetical protein
VSRHQAAPEQDERPRLTVPATVDCFARSIVLTEDGRPRLVVDYGGSELAFEMCDPRESERFGVVLAYAALSFASNCRSTTVHD